MNSANRTLAFVLVAACSVAGAVGAHMMYQPSATATKTDVGQKFYEDFDPTKATYLGVAAFNPATSKVDEFIVEKREGQWRIPSHHNYPADAKDRLAKTAASMIGVTRGQLDNTSADSHKRLNLLDPLDEKVAGAEGRGSRITIKDGDTVLTDLIIGKKEEGAGDRYYVRRPDEDRVYLASIQPELSTKFTDWIQPNVLDASAATFREIILERYSVDEAQGKVVEGERSVLERNSASDEWKLQGIPEGKKLKTTVLNQITSALGDMKIVGVRPKTPGIAALIKGDKNARMTPIDMLDMQEKGYFNSNGGIVSNEGDFLAGTSEGITYVLRFGKVIIGDDVDIEIGSSKKLSEEEAQKKLDEQKAKGADAAKPEENAAGESKEGDQKDADDKDGDESKKANRVLFVTAQLNDKLLGEPPVEPVKPEAPEGYKPKEKPAEPAKALNIPGFNDQKADDKKPETPPAEPKKEMGAVTSAAPSLGGPGPDVQEEKKSEEPAEPKAEESKPAEQKAEEPKPADAKADEKPQETKTPAENPAAPATGEQKPEAAKDPFADYEAALKKYEQEMDEFRVKKGEYDEKLKKAKEREKALNERFANWYYVIPADVFNTINVKPDELVEPEMTSAAPPATPEAGALPGLGNPADPPAAPPADPAKSETQPPPTADSAATDPPAAPPTEVKTEEQDAASPDAATTDSPPPDAPKNE